MVIKFIYHQGEKSQTASAASLQSTSSNTSHCSNPEINTETTKDIETMVILLNAKELTIYLWIKFNSLLQNLQEELKRTSTGKDILKYYAENRSLSPFVRKQLISFIVQFFVSRKRFIDLHMFKQISKTIVEIFPGEDCVRILKLSFNILFILI